MTDFTLRPLTVPERKYTYAQSSQLQGQTGNIGYLRGDFGSSGDQFYTTWFDTRPQWKSDEFKRDLDDVINALRSEEYGLLQSRSQMVRYGRENKESEMQGAYTTEFGFRADTEKYAFVLRCNPTRGDYNFYCLCYVKEWLDKHIEEANRDIRFIDSHYKELFRIPDGERIIVTDRDGKTESYPCRYIDNYHTEVGCNLFHICEFAERMEQGGCTYAPMEPPLPPMCYSILPSTGEVIQIDRWQKGYTATSFNDGNRAENEAIKDKFNEKLGVSKAQEQAMLAGSMIRWDSIAAKPKSYDENGKAKETLAVAIESAARNAVEDNIPDYLPDLLYSVKDSFLDGVSEEEITHIFKTAVRNSVAYMTMTRLGIEAGEYFEPDDLRDVVNFTTPATLNALGYATSDIAEMGLAEISRTILALDRQNRIIAEKTKADYNVGKEKTERSPDDERDHLHEAGGLSAPRSDNAGAAGAVDGQVRPDAEEVPEGASQGTLLQPADELRPERASERHGAQSERDGTDADGADGSVGGRDGESESDGYDELGSEDEQYPEPGSGDRDGGGKDIKEENYYGVPMSIVLYKDKDGNTIPYSFITQLDPPPKGFEIIDSPYLPENALDKAKHLIDDFCCEEYQREDGADYTDLTDVGVAYTTTEDDKQKFASQIMTSKSPVRSCEDIDETALSYAEIKMLATGNPHIKEKMDLDIQVQKLRLLKSSFLSEKYALEDKIIKFYPQEIARLADVIAGLKSDMERVAEHPKPSDETFVGMTVKGAFYSEKADAGNAILEACKAMTNPEPIPLGEYRGFTMELYFEAREYKVRLKGELGYPVTLGTDTFGNITRLDNALEGLPKRLEMNEMELDNIKKQFETAKVDVERPFPQEEELKAKTDRLNELNALLNVDKRENEIVGGEPDEGEEPPEKKPRDLER